MKKFIAAAVILLFAVAAWAAQNGETAKNPVAEKAPKTGAAQIVLKVEAKGDVAFPHAKHQATLKDCTLCHKQYGQEPGIIVKMKASGALEAKAVMKACIECHKKRIEAKMSAGPAACVKCHGTAQ